MAAANSSKRPLTSQPLSGAHSWRCLILLAAFLLCGLDLAWGQSTLWQSNFNGKTLYLMGSIHFLQESHYPLAPVMEEVFQESDLIVFEIDQHQMESPTNQQLFLTRGLYQEGESLEQNIGPETFQALESHLASLKLPMTIFQPMKPAYCALVITMMEFQRLGFEAKYGLDHYFAAKARRHGKKSAALESAEFQITLLFNMMSKDQEKFLKQTLREFDTFAKESGRMSQAWERGESSKLHELLAASFGEFPGLYEKLIVQRNKAWLPQIEHFLDHHQTVLVVVGAGHVVGPQSLLKLLEKKGYHFNQL